MRISRVCPTCDYEAQKSRPITWGWEPWLLEYVFGWHPLPDGRPRLCPNVLLCDRCGLVFTDVRYDEDEMARLYSDYLGERWSTIVRHRPEAKNWSNESVALKSRRDQFARLVERAEKKYGPEIKGAYLDFGGDGLVLSEELFSNMYSFNPGNHANNPKFVSRLSSFDECKKISFSFITLAHVLEHLPDPKKTLFSLHELANDRTIFHFEIPYQLATLPSEPSSLDQVPVKYAEHINFFNFKSLCFLLQKTGYLIDHLQIEQLQSGGTTKPIYIQAICRSFLLQTGRFRHIAE